MTLEEVLRHMAQHTRENPTHGYNCACKDQYLREARRRIGNLGEDVYSEFVYLANVLMRSYYK